MEEFLKQLGTSSPWIGAAAAAFIWIMKSVVQPLTARHMAWMDSMEKRDSEKTLILSNLTTNISELRHTQEEHLEICRQSMVKTHPHPKPA